jgi:hypothetical protein
MKNKTGGTLGVFLPQITHKKIIGTVFGVPRQPTVENPQGPTRMPMSIPCFSAYLVCFVGRPDLDQLRPGGIQRDTNAGISAGVT